MSHQKPLPISTRSPPDDSLDWTVLPDTLAHVSASTAEDITKAEKQVVLQIYDEQRKDPMLVHLIRYCRDGIIPDNPEAAHWVRAYDHLCFTDNGVLQMQGTGLPHTTPGTPVLVIPHQWRLTIL